MNTIMNTIPIEFVKKKYFPKFILKFGLIQIENWSVQFLDSYELYQNFNFKR